MKKYKIILADPAWSYSDSRQNNPAYAGITYDVMTTKDICDLPVKNIADKDSVCLLWVTSPMLPDGLKVLSSWGFRFKTVAFCWLKTNPKAGTPVSLMGRYTMSSMEYVLLGTKGHPKRIKNNIRQLVVAPRTGHSVKPNEVRERIVELFGDLPRVELFARTCGDGWDCFGNGIDGRDLRESLLEE